MVTLTTEKIGLNERLVSASFKANAITLKNFIPIEKIDLNVYFYISLRQQGFAANTLVHDVFCTGCV